jgi:F0F1-type ATP synthase assembly protein I
VDLRDRRELNNGFGNALSRAIDLTVTPMIFGFLGYLLDGRFGTRPFFMLGLFAFTIGYLFWKQYLRYGEEMDEHQRKITSPRGQSDPNEAAK